ncbi:MAG: thiolase family protein [Acidimicrobiales bacterium]|jgi:acetyl-CoA C-acetyltransferase
MSDAVIVSAVRTPIAKAGGGLAPLALYQIGEVVVREALKRSGVNAEDVDDLVLGETLQGGGCTARYVAVSLDLPPDTPGLAVQRQCATGMAAIQDAAAQIKAGMARVVVAGGIESMTRFPQQFSKSPFPFGGVEPFLPPSHPDTPDAPNMNMLITVGENTANECGITREEQDEWSYHSNLRAIDAMDAGRFESEVVAVEIAGKVPTTFSTDEQPRRDTTFEKLAGLRVLSGPGGTITAGNSSGIGDGGAALVVVDRDYADSHGLEILAVVKSWASAGIEPARTGLAPTVAVPRALSRAGLTTSDVDLVEINEAFASMAIACSRKLGFPHDIVNVNGGAVGIGHPVGCSGARILVTLIHELRRRGGGVGVGTLCAGGGMGSATVLEVPQPS